jgi:DNA-binding transcriptional regulator YiaG
MTIESMPHKHPVSGGVCRGRKTEQEIISVQAGGVASYKGGDPAIGQVEDFIARHPAETMAMAVAAGVVTGVVLETAPKAAAKAITTAIVGTAAVSFVGALRADWGMTLETFSRLTGYATRTIASWESGAKVGKSARRVLTKVQRLREALARVMSPDFIDEWMETPNHAFDGLKPLEVWERGEEDRIWGMIFYLESGIPG